MNMQELLYDDTADDAAEQNSPNGIVLRYVTLPNTDEDDLEAFLKNAVGGKVILCGYRQIGCLNEKMRGHLVDLIIQREVDKLLVDKDFLTSFSITSTRLSDLAEQIQRLFPSEDKSIYFTPFHTEINKKGQKIRSAAGGKLLHHYNYVKGQLLKWKVLVPPSKSGETSTSLSNDDENENENNETEHLQWLLSGHIEPLSEILVRWKSSFKERRSTSALRLNNEYVITYPCFQIYPAELTNIDFEFLYPGKSNQINENWPKVRTALLQKVIRSIKTIDFLLKTEEQQDAAIIFNLPRIVPISAIKRTTTQRTNRKKPSSHESQLAFVAAVSNPADIDSEIEKIRLSKESANETLQPFLLFVGQQETCSFESFFVVCDNNIKFEVPTAIKAVDLLFKIFFKFDYEYPLPCYDVWQFIQRLIYDITVPGEKIGQSLRELLNDMKKLTNPS